MPPIVAVPWSPLANFGRTFPLVNRLVVTVALMFGSQGVADAGPPPRRAAELVNQRDPEAIKNLKSAYRAIPEIKPEARKTTVELSVEIAENLIGPIRYRHRSYNGRPVGPTIRARAGQTLYVRLKNDLPPELRAPVHRDDEPHGFNDTNLHTHGLHVSPSGMSDNVFIDVGPGESFDYQFDIPKEHPPGTFWYHPHKHGSVALQMTSGMAGALIIEGGLDDAEELRGVEEKVLVFQQFIFPNSAPATGTVEIAPQDVYGPTRDVYSVTLINGIANPTIVIRPREVQRWRIVHAGLEETLNLSVIADELAKEGSVPLYEIAVDGLTTGAMDRRTQLELQPGYRSDVLIQAPAGPGKYQLTTEVLDVRRAVKGKVVRKLTLAEISVEGEPRDMKLPPAGSLKKYVPTSLRPIRDDEIQGPPREIELSVLGGRFTIDDKTFSPRHANYNATLGTAEEWRITSITERHPFHIHVNPFQALVVEPSTGKSKWVWRDTIFVGDGESVRLRTRFERFSGRTVVHCHNLDHEDRGMMQVLRIACPEDLKAGRPAGPGMGALPAVMPEWSVKDAAGVEHSPAGYRRSPWLLVLHRGIQCMHCARQIALLAKREAEFKKLGMPILAVCPDEVAPEVVRLLKEKAGVSFPLASDPKLEVFRAHGCLDDEVLHGTFIVDASGMVRWQSVGEEPEMNIDKVLIAAKAVADEGAQR
jgi:FtsP/CotA-like multicopper oxidase with cupredoxin domain/peroxiredoxin